MKVGQVKYGKVVFLANLAQPTNGIVRQCLQDTVVSFCNLILLVEYYCRQVDTIVIQVVIVRNVAKESCLKQ